MSDYNNPMTAHELHSLRTQMVQTPRSLADYLGVNLNTYYGWERTGKIPQPVAVALRLLAGSGHLLPQPTVQRRTSHTFKTQFLQGARFGHLTVVAQAPPTPGNRHRNVEVCCDCGNSNGKVVRAVNLINMTCCGPTCLLRKEVISAAPQAPTAADLLVFPPLDIDPDAPDLDDDDATWRRYHHRKAEEEAAAATATTTEEDNELEAGL